MLQKSFGGDERNFLGPAGLQRIDYDHIAFDSRPVLIVGTPRSVYDKLWLERRQSRHLSIIIEWPQKKYDDITFRNAIVAPYANFGRMGGDHDFAAKRLRWSRPRESC